MPQVTIDLTAQQATRLVSAWEKLYGFQPTITQVKTFLVDQLKAVVMHGENIEYQQNKPTPQPFEPS